MTHKPKVLIHRWHQLIRTNHFHLKSNGHCRWRELSTASILSPGCPHWVWQQLDRDPFPDDDDDSDDEDLDLRSFFSCCCERPESSEDPGLQALRGDQLDRWAPSPFVPSSCSFHNLPSFQLPCRAQWRWPCGYGPSPRPVHNWTRVPSQTGIHMRWTDPEQQLQRTRQREPR